MLQGLGLSTRSADVALPVILHLHEERRRRVVSTTPGLDLEVRDALHGRGRPRARGRGAGDVRKLAASTVQGSEAPAAAARDLTALTARDSFNVKVEVLQAVEALAQGVAAEVAERQPLVQRGRARRPGPRRPCPATDLHDQGG